MRASVRIAIVAIVLLSVVLFTRHFTWDGEGWAPHSDEVEVHPSLAPNATSSDIVTSTYASQNTPPISSFTASSTSHDDGLHPTATPGSKVIVMAKLEKEDTDWVAETLPEYAYGVQTSSTRTDQPLTAGIAPSTQSTTPTRPYTHPSTKAAKH